MESLGQPENREYSLDLLRRVVEAHIVAIELDKMLFPQFDRTRSDYLMGHDRAPRENGEESVDSAKTKVFDTRMKGFNEGFREELGGRVLRIVAGEQPIDVFRRDNDGIRGHSVPAREATAQFRSLDVNRGTLRLFGSDTISGRLEYTAQLFKPRTLADLDIVRLDVLPPDSDVPSDPLLDWPTIAPSRSGPQRLARRLSGRP